MTTRTAARLSFVVPLAIAALAATAACTGSSVVLIPGKTPVAGDAAVTDADGAVPDAGSDVGDSGQGGVADAADTGGDSGSGGAPDGPDAGGPDGPDAGGPDGPDAGGPDGTDAGGPDGPDAGGPDAPDAGAPDGTSPDGPDDDGGVVADSADVVSACGMLAGHEYVSRTDQPCGQGAPSCRWRVNVARDDTFTWTHDGLVEPGGYICKGVVAPIFVYVAPDISAGLLAFFDPDTRQLEWGGIVYDGVP